MNPFDIIIDNKKYEFIDSILLNNKYYVAFMDDEVTYIKEYKINKRSIELFDIDDELAKTIWEMIK
ncbi:MAG: hypothetical protein J6G98_03665 [Bacilli bacterium]|nr:hypothetical protein [Bacilli bacterium]